MSNTGSGERGFFSAVTGESVSGPDTEASEVLASRRADLGQDVKSRPLFDAWHLERNPDWSRVRTPMLSAANWGGQGLHLRGNVEAFTQSATSDKWLEVHGDAHWVDFYTDRGVGLQRRFFDYYLKGEDNGWGSEPKVQLRIRHVDGTFTDRAENEWPLARTTWTRYHLTVEGSLAEEAAREFFGSRVRPHRWRRDLHYRPSNRGDGAHRADGRQDLRLLGDCRRRPLPGSAGIRPRWCRGHVHGRRSTQHPDRPGLARASHRALDPSMSLPFRPYHSHDRLEPLVPGETYALDVEIWPTSVVIPAGYRLGLTIRGNDYRYEGELSDFAREFHYAGRGVGPFKHADPDDRPADVFSGRVSIHVGGETDSYLLVPLIR